MSGAAVAALDLRDQAAAEPLQILSSYLREREALLVFDNCEHVLDASAALVADILRAAPDVRVIATSREPLQVPASTSSRCRRSTSAGGRRAPISRLLQNEAVMLFMERAAAASGSFELSASNRRPSSACAGDSMASRSRSSSPPSGRGCSPSSRSSTG